MFGPMMGDVARHAASEDDEKLARRVYRALTGVKPLRSRRSLIQVRVSDGIVTLTGVVATYPVKAQALKTARDVAGVQQVRDELLTDSNLETKIVHALSNDPHTHRVALGIIVNAVNGLVGLLGRVPTWEIAQAAEAIAAGVPGVRAVSNHLQVGPQGD